MSEHEDGPQTLTMRAARAVAESDPPRWYEVVIGVGFMAVGLWYLVQRAETWGEFVGASLVVCFGGFWAGPVRMRQIIREAREVAPAVFKFWRRGGDG